jgi:phospholipid-transporting ATPase
LFRYWNIYFLIIGCLQQIPDLSPTGRWGTILPLMLVLFVTAVKEIWEDFQRLKQDRKINRNKVLLLKDKEWVSTMWLDIKVGDLVKVENKEPFPADLVLLSSSEDQAMAYIETSNLDGETNLKVRNMPLIYML